MARQLSSSGGVHQPNAKRARNIEQPMRISSATLARLRLHRAEMQKRRKKKRQPEGPRKNSWAELLGGKNPFEGIRIMPKVTPESQKIFPIPAEPKQYRFLYNPNRNYHDGCKNDSSTARKATTITLKPYQSFVGKYLTPENPLKGVLLYYSIGSGKLCTGINCAYQFQKFDWNVLWVTRTTLKADVDKNLFDKTCHEGIIEAIKEGDIRRDTPEERKQYFQRHFKWIDIISFKTFSNLCAGKKTELSQKLDQLNGHADPFRRTLIVIDEAHKFLEPEQFSAQERPEFKYVEKAVHHSYNTSGPESCKLLLMTGTAVGSRPEDTLLRLVNLLLPSNKIIPSDFREPRILIEKMKGLILKLDISKDPSLFAQPKYENVVIPIQGGPQPVSETSKKFYEECAPLTSHVKAKEVFPKMKAPEYKLYKAKCNSIKERLGAEGDTQYDEIKGCINVLQGGAEKPKKKPAAAKKGPKAKAKEGSGSGSGTGGGSMPKKKKAPAKKPKETGKPKKTKAATTPAKTPAKGRTRKAKMEVEEISSGPTTHRLRTYAPGERADHVVATLKGDSEDSSM